MQLVLVIRNMLAAIVLSVAKVIINREFHLYLIIVYSLFMPHGVASVYFASCRFVGRSLYIVCILLCIVYIWEHVATERMTDGVVMGNIAPTRQNYITYKTKKKMMQDKKKKVARQNSFCYVTNSFLSCSKIKKHTGETNDLLKLVPEKALLHKEKIVKKEGLE